MISDSRRRTASPQGSPVASCSGATKSRRASEASARNGRASRSRARTGTNARSMNQAEREKLYGETQDILAKEMVWIPVYNTKEIVVTRASVKGFTVHPVEYNLWLGKTWLDK